MALAQRTDIIFLDEPTTYLDICHQLEILELVQKLNEEQGCTIVMVLHDINQAIRFSDHLIAMKDGNIVANGSTQEVLTKDILEKYLILMLFLIKIRELVNPSLLLMIYFARRIRNRKAKGINNHV